MTDSAGNTAQLLELRIDLVEPWPNLNPRKRFDEEALAELTESVKEKGVLEPLLVHKCMSKREYWVVAGERRYRAAKAAGLETVPCIVRKFTRHEALEVAIVENLQRSDITPIEEARGFADWLKTTDRTQKDLAGKISRSQPYISNRIRVLELPDPILELLEQGMIEYTDAREHLVPLTKIQPEPAREALLDELGKLIPKYDGDHLQPLIRRAVEKIARPVWRYAFHHNHKLGMNEIHMTESEHKACDCHSPYKWACFDVEWWDKRNEELKTQQAEVEEEDEDERDDRLEAVRDRLAKLPIVDEATLDAELEYSWQEITEGRRLRLLLDPRDLPRERLVWARLTDRRHVEGEGLKDVEYIGLVCLDDELADAAVAGGEEEHTERLTARRRQRTQQEREEAARGTITAEVLRSLFLADDRNVYSVLRDLGLIPEAVGYWRWKEDAAEVFEVLTKTQLEVGAKVVAIRAEGGYLERDPLPGEVWGELEAEYQAALEEILPPLPEGIELEEDTTDTSPADAGADDSRGDPTEDGGEGAEADDEPGVGGVDAEASPADVEEDEGDEEPEVFEDGELIGDGPFAIRPGDLRTKVYDTRTGETVGGRKRERDARRYAEQKNEEAAAEAVTA